MSRKMMKMMVTLDPDATKKPKRPVLFWFLIIILVLIIAFLIYLLVR